MRYPLPLWLVLLVSSSTSQVDAEKTPPSALEKMADDLNPVVCYFLYGFVPPLSACEKVREKEVASLRGFSKALLKALESPGTRDHEAALALVQCYAAAARKCALDRGLKDLEAATHRVFAPYTREVEAALVKALDCKALRVRWKAASALLAFQPGHAKANLVLASGIEVDSEEFRCQCCGMIGYLHLSGRAIGLLSCALEQEEPEVRRSAANAICLIGPKAMATVPALVNLLESGDAARGSVETPFEIAPVRVANLALLALSQIGVQAERAVPVIVRLFPKATKDEQKEMLRCLSRIDRTGKKSLALIREAMKGQHSDVRIAAACALLRMAPKDEMASTFVRRALKSRDKKPRTPSPEGPVQLGTFDFMRGDVPSLRRRTLKACADVGPRSKAVLETLTALLADDNEDIRIDATLALGQAGSDAAMAIPALEKLLTKADDHQKHTFVSHQAAAYALTKIGKAAAAALIRATEESSGGQECAILSLGSLGKDAPPEAVDCLLRILRSNDNGGRGLGRSALAAIALGRLGEHARRARGALERINPDFSMALAVSWALMEVGR